MKTGLQIMILEGSEILKNNIDNKSIEKDYKGVFANSLLLDKLKEYKLEISKEETTRDIIMLNFNYGYTSNYINEKIKEIKILKLKNKSLLNRKNKLLKYRKRLHKNKNKKIFTNRIEYTKKLIYYRTIKINELKEYIQKNTMSKDDVRIKLYEEGFKLDFYKKNKETNKYYIHKTINYKFWFRTPSKSRVGDAIFINEKLLKKIDSWQRMDIKLKEDINNKVKLVEMEAYKSLTASHIENKIKFDPFTEILVVNDLDSYKETLCEKVYYHISDSEVNVLDVEDMCFVSKEKSNLKNTIWDGMALIEGGKGMKLLRQHFFKACGFATHIQKFYKRHCEINNIDYNTYKIKDRYGREILAKNIRMITTENAMKWEKFLGKSKESYEFWADHVKNDNCLFGICKTDHPSKYGKYQRMSYQMINTLPVDKYNINNITNDTITYINSLKKDDNSYIEFLERTKSDINANEMIIDLYNRNNDFRNSELFRKYRYKTISSYKDTLKKGKILSVGDNLTVCGNPYMLLEYTTGKLDEYINNNIIDNYEDKTLPKLDFGVSVYTKRFEDSEELATFRNPHNSPNNIGYNINKISYEMEEYFNFSNNIIAVNMVKTDEQDRKNGMDEDSDFEYTTNSKEIVEASKKAQYYPTIVNCIEQSGKSYNNTLSDLAKIDSGLAEAKYCIGLSSNLAQLALSWYWKEKTSELSNIVSIMSVLAQCAIDNSKRMYQVDLNKEIARIRKLECMQVKTIFNGKEYSAKPYFWQFVKTVKEKQYKKVKIKDKNKRNEMILKQKEEAMIEKKRKEEEIINHCLTEKVCPMDWVQDEIENIECNSEKSKYTKDITFIEINKNAGIKANDKQKKIIESIITELDNKIKEHNDINPNDESEEWIIKQQLLIKYSINKIKKLKIKKKTMEMLIRDSLNKNKKYKLKMLNCLYKSHYDIFLSCFIHKKSEF